MIQRIQTVYLFLVVVCLTVAMCTPVGYFLQHDAGMSAELYNLYSCNMEGIRDYSWWSLFAILCIAGILPLLAIFMYKKRMIQVRLTVFSAILLLGYYAVLVALLYSQKDIKFEAFIINWTLALPLVSMILEYLAFRSIMKDELMIRSLDRIR